MLNQLDNLTSTFRAEPNKLSGETFNPMSLGGRGGGVRSPDDLIISCRSKTPYPTSFKLQTFFLVFIYWVDFG